MRWQKYISIIIATICLCVGCNTHNASSIADDFANIVYSPRYATGFSIAEDSSGNTMLRVTRPWQGESPTEQTLAMFKTEDEAKGYNGEYIVGRAERVVCMSTSHIAMLDILGSVESIVGVSGKQYVMNERVSSSEQVYDVGYDSSLDFERLISLDPDVVLMYGVSGESSAVTSKFKELDIPYIYLGDYTEQSPLGKAEWIVAVAEIMGIRERGEEIFTEIEQRYNAVRDSISVDRRAKVMFNLPYQDVWYMPSDDSYMVRLIEDAGGDYIYKGRNPSGGSRGISLEEALLLVNKADIWLNVGQCMTLDELRSAAPHFLETAVVKRGDVYNNNRRRSPSGGSDFWESAIVRPDVVLSDLAKIMQGDDSELYYHHRLKNIGYERAQ